MFIIIYFNIFYMQYVITLNTYMASFGYLYKVHTVPDRQAG